MPNCPNIKLCAFFKDEMGDKPDIVSQSFKLRFCQGSYTCCARWNVHDALGWEAVPADLYPNQEDRAAAILELHREADNDEAK